MGSGGSSEKSGLTLIAQKLSGAVQAPSRGAPAYIIKAEGSRRKESNE